MRLKSLLIISTLTLAGCGSEYGPEEITISSKGTIVEKGTESEISGTFFLEKVTGESLTVEIDDGLPDGDVEMTDEKGNVILSSSFKSKEKQSASGFNFQFANVLFSEAIGNASTNDYLQLFKNFSEYDGDYLEVDRNNRKIEGHYENGEKLGRWQEYCENKQLSSDQTFKRFDDDVIKRIGDDLKYTCAGDVILEAKRDKKGQLQGKYIEHHFSAYSLFSQTNKDGAPKLKYIRQYKDGEFNGPQKEYSRDGIIALESDYKNGVLNGVQKKYDRNGNISLESNYKNSLKDGIENVYSSKQDYTTKEITHWLSEVKHYSNGELNGQYQKIDSKKRSLQSGAYLNDKPVGQWVFSNYKRHTKSVTDYDVNNFTLEKQKAFKDACRLPQRAFKKPNWFNNRNASIDDCKYYVENGLVDINKKIALDFYNKVTVESFERSTEWTYPVITANPNIYSYMKLAGAKTNVADSEGRTRLHYCVSQFRKQRSKRQQCSLEQLTEYSKDVNLNNVSNVGTVFHELARSYGYISKSDIKIRLANEKKVIDILIANGANLNQVNHANQTPFMAALENGNYPIAELFIDAGASIKGEKKDGKSVLGHFFLSNSNKLKRSALKDDTVRVLAKTIALGVDTQKPVLDGKTIQTLSEENNTLFHIQTLKDAAAMSNNFKESLNNRPKIDDSQLTAPADEQLQKPLNEAVNSENVSQAAQGQGKQSNEQNSALTEPVQQATSPVVVEKNVVAEKSAVPQEGNTDVEALLKQQADFLVAQANEHLANYRLKTPKSNSALGTLEQLKKIDPSNENIPLIRDAIGKKYLGLASGKINKGQKASAQNNLNSAKEFISDEGLIAQYQTKINNISATSNRQSSAPASQQSSRAAPLACNPTIKLAGIPLIGGQSLTAQQSLPLSTDSALKKALAAVEKTYLNVRKAGKKITYEQSTSTKPIKFTLIVSANGSDSLISIKAKTPTGVVIKKSGYKQGFCDLLASF